MAQALSRIAGPSLMTHTSVPQWRAAPDRCTDCVYSGLGKWVYLAEHADEEEYPHGRVMARIHN